MQDRQRNWIACTLLLIVAFSFRFCVARYLQNDSPGDGIVYAQIARNLLEQHVYSHDSSPPYEPSIIRLPGYSFFLAGVYSIFGHYNNTAVRVVQAGLDTVMCGLVGVIAYLWEPDEQRKRAAGIAAIALIAICPFTAIYVATILTETWASLLAILLCLVVTFAFLARTVRQSLWRWAAAGFIGSVGVFFRPDSGLFMAAVGLTLVIAGCFHQDSIPANVSGKSRWQKRLLLVVGQGAVLSFAFVLLLVPWTVRNWRTFHMFQPLSPAHGEMPGEYVPRGYYAWVRTWLDDRRYVETVLWTLGDKPLDLDDFPAGAFDSPEERTRVAALLDQYNHPPDVDANSPAQEPSPDPTPAPGPSLENGAVPATPPSQDADQDSNQDQTDDTEKGDQEEKAEPITPEMTPAIDTAFGQLARERIARAPLRYYLWLPLKREGTLWVGPHADYYPFAGDIFPLADLDHRIHQEIWLPLFAALVFIYSLLGLTGGWYLWRTRSFVARRWLLLVGLLILLRLAFFSTMENPEPRYTVELFPFLAVLGGITIARLVRIRRLSET